MSSAGSSACGPATGSGVIYRDDGLVLTSAHVLHSATTVEVVLTDGRSVHSGSARDFLDDADATQRLLGVHRGKDGAV